MVVKVRGSDRAKVAASNARASTEKDGGFDGVGTVLIPAGTSKEHERRHLVWFVRTLENGARKLRECLFGFDLVGFGDASQ